MRSLDDHSPRMGDTPILMKATKTSLLETKLRQRSLPLSSQDIIELDQKHVWHPYAPIGTECLPVASTKGVFLTLHDGTRLIDGMSSWWAAIHGYNHPHIINQVQDQLHQMPHIMFGGLTHAPAVLLAERLAHMTNFSKVFFSDSGSVSIEVACKMAIQYFHHTYNDEQQQPNNNNNNHHKKTKFLTVRGGYHGDTWQCMSVCDPIMGMHHMFHSAIVPQFFAPPPTPAFHETIVRIEDDRCTTTVYSNKTENETKAGIETSSSSSLPQQHIGEFQRLLGQHASEIAAVILEPIVQGAGGMRFYHPQYLNVVRRLCTEHNVLLIYDEIATGFGRTGKLFAKDYVDHEPDILCLGKALTGGTMSLAATLTTNKVAQALADGPTKVLMHGPTFMGNPLACSAALASLDLIETGYWKTAVSNIEQQLYNELMPCWESKYVQDVRVLGAIGVVEYKEPIQNLKQMIPEIVQQGVWLRPFGKLLYTMPPYVISPDQLRKITRAMVHLSHKLF